jgi:hypothetical protein
MIANGNEDNDRWTKTLCLVLKQACPIISEQGFSQDDRSKTASMNGQRPFIFVSNRDKGLKLALKNDFFEHVEMSCAKHMETNITQRFGNECGRHVMAMAKTYSVQHFNKVLDLIRTSKSTAASKYIEGIGGRGVLWSNS